MIMKVTVIVLWFWMKHHVTVSSLNLTSPISQDGDEKLVPLSEKACRFWPQVSKFPFECCSVPEFFEQNIKQKCISYCTRPEEESFNTVCCTSQCLLEETEIVYDGGIIAENAKIFLTKVFEKNEKIVQKLDKIISKCEKKVPKPIPECETPQYGSFLTCLHQKLLNSCAEVKPDSECKEIKEFMEKCPNSPRRFKENKRASTKPMKDSLAAAMKEVISGKSS